MIEAILVEKVAAKSEFWRALVKRSGLAKYARDNVMTIQKMSVGRKRLNLSAINCIKLFGLPNFLPSSTFVRNSFWPIKKPEMTKKISTARNPPGNTPGKQ